jgi:hypothetical protein
MKSNLFSSRFESYDFKKRLIFTLILALIIPAYIDVQKANAVDCSPTQSRVGNTIIQSFTNTTTCDWTVPAGVTSIRYLIVGGGGSGGSGRGGGGGAGGVVRGNVAVTSNQALEIKVGSGGTGNNTPGSNSNGDTSSITTLSLVAPGGGRGGSHINAGTNNNATESGSNGGSGGGSSMNYGSVTSSGGSSSGGTVLGNNGAASSATCSTRDGSNRNTGGGGGAGSVGIYGCNTTTNGTPVGFDSPGVKPNGGDGVADTITGTSVTYATGGGGAGGRGNDSQGGYCEAGMYSTGSGEGGSSNVNGGRGQDCDSELSATVANRGAGGGGVTRGAGGNGGSGIVIISYASTTPTYGGSCTSGFVTQTFDTSTGSQIEIFNVQDSVTSASCSFVVPSGVVAVDYLVVAGGGGGGSGGGGAGGLVSNRAIRNEADTATLGARRSALAVRTSETITITVGAGGRGGAGGYPRYSTSPDGTAHLTQPANGSNSVFGSIRAIGGGAGGHRQVGFENAASDSRNGTGQSGGSGGGSSFDQNNTSLVSSTSQSSVSGASTFGNAGGSSSGEGGYRGGTGGGGAGTAGGTIRVCSTGSSTTNLACGGVGGDGVLVDILNTGSFVEEYACGGGGGINANSNQVTANGGGGAGCSSSGRGSNYGNLYTNYTPNDTTRAAMATSGTDGYGGGGGGTDPEDSRGGRGGSGVVIISYFVNNSACPNNGVNATSTRPLACNFTISIRAGRDTVTVDPRGNPYSYSDTPTTTARLTIGVDSITITVSNNLFTISAPGTNNPLRGGTYPALYSLTTTGTDTSSAYVMVNVTDPGQHSPTRVGINPWVTTVKVPAIVFGTISAVLVCITPRASTASGYGNLPTVTMSSLSANALRTNLTNGGIKLEGTIDSITANASNFIINKNSSDTRLLPGSTERVFDINVSNSATGGNGSCTGGSESTLSIYRLNYLQKNTKNLPLKNGKQP